MDQNVFEYEICYSQIAYSWCINFYGFMHQCSIENKTNFKHVNKFNANQSFFKVSPIPCQIFMKMHPCNLV